MHWVNRLDVKDIWQAAKTDKDAPKLARGMAERIKAHKLYKRDEQLRFIAFNFERLAANPDTDFDDTDLAYEALCQWGDAAEFDVLAVGWGKRCWIATF
jgi:hypothetical protein